MRIIKKINNNVGLGTDQNGNEVFVVGKGIGFRQVPYDLEDNSILIEKVYVATDTVNHMELFKDIPKSMFDISNELLVEGERVLSQPLNPNLVFTLADHIQNALERGKSYTVANLLEYDIRQIYPLEYDLGKLALDRVEATFGKRLEDSEAAFMALHFVNAQFQSLDFGNANQVTEVLKDIIHLVKMYYKSDFKEDGINLSRFATHIRHFAVRQLNDAPLPNQNENFYQLMKQEHPKAYDCVLRIESYLSSNYGWDTSNDEKLYLMLHIQRLTSRK